MSVSPKLRDRGNDLLDRLPPDEFEPLKPLFKRVSFTIREIVQQYEADVTHVHFPTTALTSLLTVLEDDDPVEAAAVGREGFLGLAASPGVESSPIGPCARWPATASACRSDTSWRRSSGGRP